MLKPAESLGNTGINHQMWVEKVGGIYVQTKHLELRRKTWFCVLDVPAPLRAIVGQSRLRRTLGTHDVMEALERRGPVLDEFKAKLSAAAAKLESQSPTTPAIP